MLHFGMTKISSRRNFLRVVPLAAMGLPVAQHSLVAAGLARDPSSASTQDFEIIPAESFASSLKSLPADSAQHFLYRPESVPLTLALFSEGRKPAGEFEYHDGRDHVFQILDGSATFELGGTPQNPRSNKPGEWLAANSIGAKTVPVKKGDMLLIPRGTPHRHSTETSVQWLLISDTASPKS